MRRPLETLACGLIAFGLLAPAAFAASDLDERHVVAQGDLPAVGLLTGNGRRCTGFLAGSDRVIVTAAHCVFTRDGQPYQGTFEFQPGYRNGTSAGLFRASVATTGNYHPSDDPKELDQLASDDWAMLLTEKPTGIAPLDLISNISISQIAEKPLSDVGYSVDIENGRFLTEDSSCRVIRTQDFRIDHSCRGSVGSSGGPIFLLNDDGSRGPVVGVVSSGSVSSTSERLVMTHLRLLASLHTIPDIDFGGHAVFVGAFVNGAKMLARTPPPARAAAR